jgi:hypothetical protein
MNSNPAVLMHSRHKKPPAGNYGSVFFERLAKPGRLAGREPIATDVSGNLWRTQETQVPNSSSLKAHPALERISKTGQAPSQIPNLREYTSVESQSRF